MGKRKPRRTMRFTVRRRTCLFCDEPDIIIDYKNTDIIKKYLSDRGKIVARRVNGNCAKHQRQLARVIKRARFIALAPFKIDIYR
ncbi:30S ribosomal protein S18 [bacterium]|nr:30S ribosomal protein S18 [bacterium]